MNRSAGDSPDTVHAQPIARYPICAPSLLSGAGRLTNDPPHHRERSVRGYTSLGFRRCRRTDQRGDILEESGGVHRDVHGHHEGKRTVLA